MAFTIAGPPDRSDLERWNGKRPLFPRSVTRLQRPAILSTETGYTSRQCLEMVSTIVVRPDEESRSGGPANFKWPSLRIWSGNGSRSDAKGIIVGVHERHHEPSLIKALS
jgi:hypothetical protein